MTIPKTKLSTFNSHIVNSQPCPLYINLIGGRIKLRKYQKETKNVSNKLQIITHPSNLESARKIPPHSPNP
jgi:hypothetical protein